MAATQTDTGYDGATLESLAAAARAGLAILDGKPRLDHLNLFLKEGSQEKLEESRAELHAWIVWIPS